MEIGNSVVELGQARGKREANSSSGQFLVAATTRVAPAAAVTLTMNNDCSRSSNIASQHHVEQRIPKHRVQWTKNHDDPTIANSTANTATITITTTEYHSLLQFSREYKALRAALISGGVPPENLDILISHPPPEPEAEPEWRQTTGPPVCKPNWSAQAKVFVPKSNLVDSWRSNPQSTVPSPATLSCTGDEPLSSPASHLHNDYFEEEQEEQEEEEDPQCFDTNNDDRSLTLRGISPFTTLADILKHVRGGQILHCFKRARSAHISFVNPTAAEKFLIYSKRADLYIRNKRVEVFWDDRQQYLPGYLAHRIFSQGATRNLVIRFPKPDMTAESIKEDLAHIHRLETISITFDDAGHAYISTNSISQALVARTCMSSRLKYKSTRIEFYPDECDQPMPQITRKAWKKTDHTRPASISYANRFATLDALNSMEDDHDSVVLKGEMGRSISAGVGVPVQ